MPADDVRAEERLESRLRLAQTILPLTAKRQMRCGTPAIIPFHHLSCCYRNSSYGRCSRPGRGSSCFVSKSAEEKKIMGGRILPWGSFPNQGGEWYKILSPPHRHSSLPNAGAHPCHGESLDDLLPTLQLTSDDGTSVLVQATSSLLDTPFSRGYEIATPQGSLISPTRRETSCSSTPKTCCTRVGAKISPGAH